MSTLSAYERPPEPLGMTTRTKTRPRTLRATAATIGILIAIAAGGIGLWEGHDNKVAAQTREEDRNHQTEVNQARQELAFQKALDTISTAFDRAMARVENSVGIVNLSVSDLAKTVAHLAGRVEGLADRVENIERRRNP